MRRIIERVVTVVTTTTWRISWEADTPRSDDRAEPVSNDLPTSEALPETAQHAPSAPIAIEIKEVETLENENMPDQA